MQPTNWENCEAAAKNPDRNPERAQLFGTILGGIRKAHNHKFSVDIEGWKTVSYQKHGKGESKAKS